MHNDNVQQQVIHATQEFGIASVLFRNAIGRQLGLNITDIGCLNYLFIKGTSTPTELAHYAGLTTGSATTMIDRLERLQLITRSANPTDRRSLIINIKDGVRERIGPMVSGTQKAQKELLSSYSDTELVAIADFLTRFTNNINESTNTLQNIDT
jgi:DNA-binding MarR family transcriptional regulator